MVIEIEVVVLVIEVQNMHPLQQISSSKKHIYYSTIAICKFKTNLKHVCVCVCVESIEKFDH